MILDTQRRQRTAGALDGKVGQRQAPQGCGDHERDHQLDPIHIARLVLLGMYQCADRATPPNLAHYMPRATGFAPFNAITGGQKPPYQAVIAQTTV